MKITVGKRWDKGSVYIGRRTPLGNPFEMADKSDAERNRVCDAYAVWIRERIAARDPKVLAELARLRRLAERPEGVILGCYCAPKRCHGDTIRELIEEAETPV